MKRANLMDEFEKTLSDIRVATAVLEERYSQILDTLGQLSERLDDTLQKSEATTARHDKELIQLRAKVNKAHWFISGVAAAVATTVTAIAGVVSSLWQMLKG
ncbi:MAG: hypothetical protein AAFN78_00960 [Pseudomonadota bacterium]